MVYPAGPPNPAGDPLPGAPAGCARHPDRPTGLRCTRCDRPACPDCLHEASVGFQCVDCVAQGRRGTRRGVTVAGAELGRRPLVVPLLVAVNLAIFALTVAQAGSVSRNDRAPLFQEWALAPAAVVQGEWWRLLTSGFLHFGLLHVGLNMLSLYIIGRDLEPVLGRARFLAVYGLSLLGGSATVMLVPEAGRTAGASGAIFGLFGALVLVLIRLRMSPVPALLVLALNLYLTFQLPFISWQAHIGGLVVGTLAAAALLYAPQQHRNRVQTTALAGLTLVLLVVIAVATALP